MMKMIKHFKIYENVEFYFTDFNGWDGFDDMVEG